MQRVFICVRVFLSLSIAVAMWEVCARIDDAVTDGAPFWGAYGYETMLTQGPHGVVGKPGGHYLKWKLNSLGFRGPEPQGGRFRILCVGASETFGQFESEQMEYPRQLERELNARAGGQRYEVINVAYAGQTLSSFVARSSDLIRELRPNMVVIYPSLANYIDPPPASGGDVSWLQPQHKIELRITGKIFHLVERVSPESLKTLAYQYQIWKKVRNRPLLPRIPEENVQRFRQDIAQLLDTLETCGVDPVLVTHATRFGQTVSEPERPMLIAWRRFYPQLADDGFLDMERRLNGVIREESQARHLLLVDAAQQLHGRDLFADWVHFTDGGAGRMAKLLAEGIFRPHAAAGNATLARSASRSRRCASSTPVALNFKGF